MRMTTLSLAAVFTIAAASTASAGCNWSKDTVAQSTIDMKPAMEQHVETAQAPVDAWLIKYLEDWQKA